MDSPVFNTIKNVAGYGVGTLAALDTIKGGGLGSYLMNRQRLMSDPGFRATLAGSPFMAGVFGVSGDTGPAPAAPGLPAPTGATVAQPPDMVGPPAPAQVAPPGLNVPGYMPGTPRQWAPNLPPYDPEQALKQRGFATLQEAIAGPDLLQSGLAKTAAGIMPTRQETNAVLQRAADVQKDAGPGSTVVVDFPGMKVQQGSPYNLAAVTADEYPTYALALAAAAGRNASIPAGNPQWTVTPSGRGTYLLAPPATQAQTMPAQPPAPVRAPPPAPAPIQQPPQQPAQQPIQQPAPPPPTPPAPPPPAAAAPPPPPPPPPPAPAAPPPVAAAPAPPLRAAQAPSIYEVPGRAPAYIPPGTPEMAPSVRVAPGSPPMGGRVGYPSAAFDSGDAGPAAPPPAVGGPAGRVNLHAPFFRQLEAERGLPVGVLSALAEQESHGDPNAANPQSSARGLFQITAPTALAWGLSPEQRFDPVQSAIATANVLAQRAQSVGIQRAVGMHYGGPGAAYADVVGPSGLSPAQYSAAVLARAEKYGGAPGDVGYPPPAPEPVDYRGVPFRRAVPDLTPHALGLPPPPRAGVPADLGPPTGVGPPLFPLVDAQTGVPLSGVTEKGGSREQTYSVPSPAAGDVAANMQAAGITDWRLASDAQIKEYKRLAAADEARKKVMDADIARARGATPAENTRALNVFNDYRQALNTYLADFPTPEERAKYIGWLNRPIRELRGLVQSDPRFELFTRDLQPFQYKAFNSDKGALSDDEQHALANLLPTGHEDNAVSHEERLQGFNDIINARLGMRTAQLHMAPDEITPAWWNAANQAVADQAAADKAQMGGGTAGAVLGAVLARPPAAPPPAVPPPVGPAPTGPPPFTVFGQWQE